MRQPKIGDTVVYRLNDDQKKDHEEFYGSGRPINLHDELPAVIVAVWGDTPDCACNLKVFVDGLMGNDWVTSVDQGNDKGQFYYA